MFVGAADSTLLHFNGNDWHRLPLPGSPNCHQTFTGIAVLPTGEIFIAGSGNEGRLLHGCAASLAEFRRYPEQLIDIAVLDGRVLFAPGDGIAELSGKNVQMLKKIPAAGISAGLGRLFVIEPARPEPSFIEYQPADANAPWYRFAF